ncbi:hypothetical protein [Streptococcus merionis]|uniref:hypothetical protein n=1 Tax=Streptococcus merionis TaxID=400065 RepID=UPI003F7D7B3F
MGTRSEHPLAFFSYYTEKEALISIEITTFCGIYCWGNGKAIHKPVYLFNCQGFDLLFTIGPDHFAIFKAFVEQLEILTIPVKSFEAVFAPATEEEDDT